MGKMTSVLNKLTQAAEEWHNYQRNYVKERLDITDNIPADTGTPGRYVKLAVFDETYCNQVDRFVRSFNSNKTGRMMFYWSVKGGCAVDLFIPIKHGR